MDLPEKDKTDVLSDENTEFWGKHNARRIYMCLFTNLDNGKEWTDTQFDYMGPGRLIQL